ncbi:MAG: ferredoxin [Clostridiaceae bacterium]|nr:ferredoxin [Clostridiaceae bacterium]
MKGFVNKNSCIGCGICVSLCPEVFIMDNDGKAEAIDSEIQGRFVEDAKDAETGCPVGAITIE